MFGPREQAQTLLSEWTILSLWTVTINENTLNSKASTYFVLAGDRELFWKDKDTSQTLQSLTQLHALLCKLRRDAEWKRSNQSEISPGSGSVWLAAALEEVVMMTALTRRRCTKAWQVGQLPWTHYFSPGTKLVMCKVTPVTDWPIVNRETSQVLHADGGGTVQGYAGRENMMHRGKRFASLVKTSATARAVFELTLCSSWVPPVSLLRSSSSIRRTSSGEHFQLAATFQHLS